MSACSVLFLFSRIFNGFLVCLGPCASMSIISNEIFCSLLQFWHLVLPRSHRSNMFDWPTISDTIEEETTNRKRLQILRKTQKCRTWWHEWDMLNPNAMHAKYHVFRFIIDRNDVNATHRATGKSRWFVIANTGCSEHSYSVGEPNEGV